MPSDLAGRPRLRFAGPAAIVALVGVGVGAWLAVKSGDSTPAPGPRGRAGTPSELGPAAPNLTNVGSPVATNLTAVEDYRSEYPFVDFAKQARPWFGGTPDAFDDGTAPPVDEFGNVVALESGRVARTLIFDGEPADPTLLGRRFVVTYTGRGTLEYEMGARVVSRSRGRDVIEVVGNGPGGKNIVVIAMTETVTSDPLRDLRIVPDGGICAGEPFTRVADAAACPARSFRSFEAHRDAIMFNPEFLERIRRYRGLRFMDWMRTNDSTQRDFADRPHVADQFWSTEAGVPVEVMVDLANRVDADPWFTIPHRATDDYVTRFAEVVHDGVEPNRIVNVEYSNEVWNSQFGQTTAVRDEADALDLGMTDHDTDPTTARVEDPTIGMLRLYSRRAAQVHALFVAEFGGTERLRRVMASQAVVPFFTETILEFEGAAENVDLFAVAPYFGDTASEPETVAAYKDLGVDGVFAWLRGERAEPRLELDLARVDRVVAEQVVAAGKFGVALTTYEGGQHFVGADPSDEPLNDILDAVNRDPRMHGVYLTYLENWRRRSGEVFWHFQSCDRWSGHGRWGALEYQSQPREQAPKFDALMDFIEDAVGS